MVIGKNFVSAHNKLKVVPATQPPRALSIVQGRALGVTHYLLGGHFLSKNYCSRTMARRISLIHKKEQDYRWVIYIYIYTRHLNPMHSNLPSRSALYSFFLPPSIYPLLNLSFLPQETQFPISPLFSYQEFVIFCPRISTAPISPIIPSPSLVLFVIF